MKKLVCLLAVLLLAMTLIAGVFAEEAINPVVENPEPPAAEAKSVVVPDDPFDWGQLATIAGATLATLLIVQLLKLPMDKVWKIPTRIIVYVIALAIITVATHFTTGLTWNSFALGAVNAVIVALAAMGSYDLTFKKLEEKKQTEDE